MFKIFKRANKSNNGMSMMIEVIGKDANGKVIKRICKKNDLYMDNFAYFIAGIFKQQYLPTDPTNYPARSWGDANPSSNNGMGGNKTKSGVGDAMSPCGYSNATWGGALTVLIGTNSTAAHHDQNEILTYITGGLASPTTAPVVTVGQGGSGEQALITFGATITLGATGYTVAEAALEIEYLSSGMGGGTPAQIPCMIARDVFTGIAIPAYGSITINYTLVFNQ